MGTVMIPVIQRGTLRLRDLKVTLLEGDGQDWNPGPWVQTPEPILHTFWGPQFFCL